MRSTHRFCPTTAILFVAASESPKDAKAMTPTCDMEVTLSAFFKTLDHHEVMEYGSGHELV